MPPDVNKPVKNRSVYTNSYDPTRPQKSQADW